MPSKKPTPRMLAAACQGSTFPEQSSLMRLCWLAKCPDEQFGEKLIENKVHASTAED